MTYSQFYRADEMLGFMEEECRTTILPWIKHATREIYEVDLYTGKRIRNRSLVSMGKKNGKTHIMATWMLGHMVGPEAKYHPPASQFAGAAGANKDQARIAFKSMKTIIRSNREMERLLTIGAETIYHAGDDRYFDMFPAKAESIHGCRPEVWCYDELAQALNASAYEALETSQGTVDEPLGFIFSTNANRPGNPLAQLIADVKRAQKNGKLMNWSVHVYAADPEEVEKKPFLIKHIKAANPSFGTVLKREAVMAERAKAMASPTFLAKYRADRLNIDVDNQAALVDLNRWARCGDSSMRIEDYEGRQCIVAIDLSTNVSLSSMAFYFPDDTSNTQAGGDMFAESWIPDAHLNELENAHGAPYELWHKAGHLHKTRGEVVELDDIIDRLEEVSSIVNVVAVLTDSHRKTQLGLRLKHKNYPLEPRFISQSFSGMSTACQAFVKLVANGGLRHNDNPVTNFCVRNSVAIIARRSTSNEMRVGRIGHQIPNDACVAMVETLSDIEIKPKRNPGLDVTAEEYESILARYR